ncbi:MAG: hypothetical protein IKE91_02370 [Clostridia bacterium]|nr:hypothetical protein [Clostridia bacterium]
MKIKGSFLQKFLLVVQVVFMLTAIGIDIYMNVKHNYNLAIANISKALLYFCIGLGLVISLLQPEDETDKDEEKSEEKKDEEK